MKTVLILSQYFYGDGATGQVLTQLAEDLVQSGCNVKVIAGQPNYIDQYEKKQKFEKYNDINVWRINYLRFNKNSKIGRILGYLSFPLSVILKIFFIGQFDSVLIVSNPPTLPIIGCLIKKIKRVKYTYLLHDLYPDVAIRIGVISKKNLMAKFMEKVNELVFDHADQIVVLGKDVKRLLIDKGLAPNKVHIITNWADKRMIDKSLNIDFKRDWNIDHKFIILYTGNIGLFHNLEYTIHSMAKINQLFEDVCLVFVGEGGQKKELQKIVKKMNINNVAFFTYQNTDEYGELLRTADLLLVSLAKGLEGISVPSKTYSYLAAGRPILAVMSKDTEIGSLIEETKAGIRVDPDDRSAFVKAVEKMYCDKKLRCECGRNARKIFEENYERKFVTSKFVSLL